MIVLDTNVLSELIRQQPAEAVLAWADQLCPQEVAITAMNEAEILHGIARLADSQRKQQLEQGWDALLKSVLQHPVLPFNSDAAHWFAALVSHREGMGRPISTAAAVITATFTAIGLSLINPWSLDDRSI